MGKHQGIKASNLHSSRTKEDGDVKESSLKAVCPLDEWD